jgi:hypothetical protein
MADNRTRLLRSVEVPDTTYDLWIGMGTEVGVEQVASSARTDPETIRRNGSKRQGACVLPALRADMGDASAHDESVAARTVSSR